MKTTPRYFLYGALCLFLLSAYCRAETIETRKTTGYASFIHSKTATPLDALRGLSKAYRREDLSQRAASELFLNHYAGHFGIRDSKHELQLLKTQHDAAGNSTQQYQQIYQSIPVFGAELRVNVDSQNALRSINGQISPFPELDVVPTISAQHSHELATTAFEKWYPTANPSHLKVSQPEQVIYDPRLLLNDLSAARLAWKVQIHSPAPYPIHELMLVDAQRGGILLHFNQIHSALSRETYTANNTIELNDMPLSVSLVCDESDPRCLAGDADAQAAHDFAKDTYHYFLTRHARDSFDDKGATAITVTHYGVNLPNAFWDSERAIFGDGLARLDDVVAHELTHAFTESTSNLYYYDQSGAINESLSDLWGEFIDLQNGKGDDSASVRWEIGEEAPRYSQINTSIRDMQNPSRFNHPDKMTSPYYFNGTADNRGVHINSGVNNKAVVLLVDGGTFNGKTVTALGIQKVSDIYYEAQTTLLGQTSTYPDLYLALQQACNNLMVSGKTTIQDCNQVKNALEAVEMNIDPVNNLRPQAHQCAASESANLLYFTGFENTVTDWESTTLSGTVEPCITSSDDPKSGSQSAFCSNISSESDTVWQQKSEVSLPANAYLHFHHNYLFEPEYDYGLVEYSTDNGNSWQSAHPLVDDGKEPDTVIMGFTSFNGHSLGYVSTRYDLNSLSGENVLFRFRIVSDLFVGAYGWLIDDFSIYTCLDNDSTPDVFSFSAKNDAELNSQQTSNTVQITGINSATAISINGGEYQINGGGFTTTNGIVQNHDTIRVRHTSATSYNTHTITTLTIGQFQTIFSSTTLATPSASQAVSGGGGSISWWLLVLIGLSTLVIKRIKKTQRLSSAFGELLIKSAN